MDYLVQQLWLFLLIALIIGLIVGWFTCKSNESQGK